MLKDITLGQYFPGDTLAHRLDPRTKLILVVLYIVALFLAVSFVSYALMFLVLALFIWEVWELIQGGDTNLPAFLLGAQVVIFCLAQWLGRARVGDDRVKREVVIWIILTAALVLFGVLLALGV